MTRPCATEHCSRPRQRALNWLVYGVFRCLFYLTIWYVVARQDREVFVFLFVLIGILRFERDDVLDRMKRNSA